MSHSPDMPLSSNPGGGGGGGGVTLKRRVTLTHGVSLIVGSIIGSGVFVSPGGVLSEAGSPLAALLVWLAGGVFCTLGALVFAELGTMLPTSGGEFIYILEAFGNLPAFLALWSNVVLIRPMGQAVVALTFAEYALAPYFDLDCHPPKLAVCLLAAMALCLLTAINCLSVRLAMKIQLVCTAAKIFALAAIIVAGAIYLAMGHTEVLFSNALQGNTSMKDIPLAFYSALFAYGGWNYLNFVTEELKDPYRSLPRAISIALPAVTCLYVLVNLSYLAVLTPVELVASTAVAVSFAREVVGWAQYWVPLFVSLSTFGSLNGILFTSGRLFLAGARCGHLPPVLSYIHTHAHTPVPALLVTCGISLLMLGMDIYSLINSLSFALWLTVGTAVAALLWMRRTHPHTPRPIKVHISLPVCVLIGCIYLVVVPVIREPKSTGLGVLMTLTGLPVYLLGVAWTAKPKWVVSSMDGVTHVMQKLIMVVEPSPPPPPSPM